MKTLSSTFLFSIAFSFLGLAQNLVPNSSFELEAPEETDKVWFVAEGWKMYCKPSVRYGPSSQEIIFADEKLPVRANTGKSYVGIGLLRTEINFRSFLLIKLKEILKKEEEYRIGFYIRLNKNSNNAIKNLGINFTSEEISCDSVFKITNPTVDFSRGYYFNDSTYWMLVSSSYKAKGAEEYLCFGNFNNDINQIVIPDSIKYSNQKYGFTLIPVGLRDQGAFYFVDDFFVIAEKEYSPDISKTKFEKGKLITLNNLFFETDKSDLLPTSFTELDKVVEILKNNPALTIVIRGHTDNIGTEEHNQQLSLDRANAGMNYIIKKGIAANRLSTWGFGSSRPLASNVTEEGKAMNRRVEILVK